MYLVQFEEKKFLETARKIIQSSVGNAGQRMENDNILLQKPNLDKKQWLKYIHYILNVFIV